MSGLFHARRIRWLTDPFPLRQDGQGERAEALHTTQSVFVPRIWRV